MLGLIQAVLQTEASASRAAQQLLAEEDQAAASAAAKKAKKKQRQKARKQLTHDEVASVEQAPVESTAAPAVVTTFTQAAADCTHSNQLTDAHTSAAVADDMSPVTGSAWHTRAWCPMFSSERQLRASSSSHRKATDRAKVLVTCSAKMLAEALSSTSRQLLHDPPVISRGHTVRVCVHLLQ